MSFNVPAGISIQPTPLLQSLLNDAGYTYNSQGQLVPPSALRGMYGTMSSEVLNNLLAPYGLKAGQKINLSDNYNILYQSSTGDSGIPSVGQPMGGSPVTDGSMTPDAQGVGTPNYDYYSPPQYTAADVYRPSSSLPNLYDMYSPYEDINMPFNPFTGQGGYRGQMQTNVTPPPPPPPPTPPPTGGGQTPPDGGGQTPPAGGGTTPGGGNPNRIVLPNGNVLIKNPDGSVTIIGPDGNVVRGGSIPGGGGIPLGSTPAGGIPTGGTPAGGTPLVGIASLGNTSGGGAPTSQATPTWVNPVDPGTVPHVPTTSVTPTGGTSGTQRTTSSGTVYTQANPVYVNPTTGGAGGGDPLSEIVVTAKRIPTPGDEDEELPETIGKFMGGAVRGPRPVDQGISPELMDRQRAVTQMLARRAAMMQQAAGMQMPQGGSPAQMLQNTAIGPQGLPPQMSAPPTPAPQAPVNALAAMAPQGQFNPMQQGIMGAPQLRGGF